MQRHVEAPGNPCCTRDLGSAKWEYSLGILPSGILKGLQPACLALGSDIEPLELLFLTVMSFPMIQTSER